MNEDMNRTRDARRIIDEVELEDYAGRAALAEEPAGPGDTGHHDQYAKFTHDVPEQTSEAASRVLVRLVPVAYGLLLGGLAGNLALGLAGGALVAMLLDLRMGAFSLARDLSRRILARVCPAVAAVAHGLVLVVRRVGLKVPAALANLRCGAPLP